MSNEEVRSWLESDVMANVTTLCELLMQSDIGDEVFLDVYDIDNWDRLTEPMEYWMVTPKLGEMLRDQGKSVMSCISHAIWVRQTFGQSIYVDEVMQKAAEKKKWIHDELLRRPTLPEKI